MWFARLGLLVLALYGGPAQAACRASVSPLNPELDSPYPSKPALPWTPPSGWAAASTAWSTTGVEILESLNSAASQQFIAQGVNYEPTQIGGGAGVSPFNDFFYTNGPKTWAPLWDRDVEALRAMKVNAIRTYGWWKWEPGFLQASPTQDGLAPFWQQIDFSVGGPEVDTPFCYPGPPQNPNILTYPHPTHLDFLNRLWNNGVNPIYVWIGISLPLELFDPNVTPARKAYFRQFYKYTARWAAQKYGNHPAVMGFVIGNEVDNGSNVTLSDFWNELNDFNALVKASAPNKLTMSVFHDGPNPFATIASGSLAGKTGPQVYNLDVLGDNPYNDPAAPGNELDRFKAAMVTNNCKTTAGLPCLKPLLYTEFGVPADTHQNTGDTKRHYPNTWSEANFIWDKSPPPSQCVSPTANPPPGSGGQGPDYEFSVGKTIALELPATSPKPVNKSPASYAMPASLASFFSASGVKAGDLLPAADQAIWIEQFWNHSVVPHLASNGANRDTGELYTSGGFVFEWRDEWWKGNETYPYFHSISGSDSCSAGCPAQGCDTGGSNVVFPGGWGDEEWFGLTGSLVNPNRCPAPFNCGTGNGKNSDPVVNYFTGALNGGPDILKPRAATVALCRAFGGCP